MSRIRRRQCTLLITLAALLMSATAQAELILFTSILNDQRGGSSSVPFPRSLSLGMTDTDFYNPIPVFPSITVADIGQTIVADRSTIGTPGWQRINGLLSQGDPNKAPSIDIRGGGRSIGKACLFKGIEPCNGYVVEPSWDPPNGIDLEGFHIDEFALTVNSLSFTGGNGTTTANAYSFNYTLRFYGSAGQVPEPSTLAIITVACGFFVLHHTPAFRRQWSRTASKSVWFDTVPRRARNCTRPE